jgi:hypothetical protein
MGRLFQLVESGHTKEIGRIVEVERRHPVDGDVGVQLGVRRTGEHLDMVAQVFQAAAQLFEIDALTAAVGVAAIGEQADTERSIHGFPIGAARIAAGLAGGAGPSWQRHEK